MPELPDIEAYVHALRERVVGETLLGVRMPGVFLLRSVDPPLTDCPGRSVLEVSRLGKRIVFGLQGELSLVLHLMIAGRLRWKRPGAKLPGKAGLAAFDFDAGTLVLTEAGTRRRASLHVVRAQDLDQHRRSGIEVLQASLEDFRRALSRERHTLKRSLTDPRILSGIGNAYSDEILHRARLSPFTLSDALDEAGLSRLYEATQSVLREFSERILRELKGAFPDKVTAFRPDFAVHGRYREPCPRCGAPVQRIRYASNEANYCAPCQTGGRLLRDRSLSRLLKKDWPRTLEELELLRQR